MVASRHNWQPTIKNTVHLTPIYIHSLYEYYNGNNHRHLKSAYQNPSPDHNGRKMRGKTATPQHASACFLYQPSVSTDGTTPPTPPTRFSVFLVSAIGFNRWQNYRRLISRPSRNTFSYVINVNLSSTAISAFSYSRVAPVRLDASTPKPTRACPRL